MASRYRYRPYGHRRFSDGRVPAPVWVAGGVVALAVASGGAHAAVAAPHHAAPVTAAAGIGNGQPAPSHASHAHRSTRAATAAIAFARAQLGKPYQYAAPRYTPGNPTPATFDCSSLTQWAWAAAGVSIPGTSETQWAQLPHVTSPQPGDLLFYTGSPVDPPPGHVTMYLGGGQMIEAYATGYPIRITPVRAGAWGAARP